VVVASSPWPRPAGRTSARLERLCKLSLAWWPSVLAEEVSMGLAKKSWTARGESLTIRRLYTLQLDIGLQEIYPTLKME